MRVATCQPRHIPCLASHDIDVEECLRSAAGGDSSLRGTAGASGGTGAGALGPVPATCSYVAISWGAYSTDRIIRGERAQRIN